MLKLNLSRAITSALLAAFMAGAGAAEAPQPGLAVPERFISVPVDATLASNGEVEFWRSFGDAQLTALVERALHENHDLRIALAHFESANALLRGARCLVYPSLYEGFGLPILEAMACGTPVVTSRGGATEEVAAGAAVLVDPRDPAAIAAGIGEAVRRRDELVAAGLTRAAAFTWDRSADLVEALWRELA